MHRSTLARWLARDRRGEALATLGGPPRRPVSPCQHEAALDLVRSLRGLVGVESLRHSIDGLSRSQARDAKHEALHQMELERRGEAERITVLSPGIVRGFDAMYLRVCGERRFLLVSTDAAVPYRTYWDLTPRYDAQSTAALMAADFERQGAPLVMRFDRARHHGAPAVQEVLDAHEVLALHGPAYYPRYYGQLERQNREHRAWLQTVDLDQGEPVEAIVERMMRSLNVLWRRPSLRWLTASQAWDQRATPMINRAEFRKEVVERKDRIRMRLGEQHRPADLPERLAIEQTLARRGLLRREVGGWC